MESEININIITLSPKQFKTWLELLIEIYHEAYQGLSRYAYRHRGDIRSYIRWLYRVDPQGFLVAKGANGPVGFIATCRHWWDRVHGEVGEMHELVVHPDHQGQGIGRLLFQAGLNYLRQERQTITLWVGENNAKAIAFYRKWGFKRVGKVGQWLRMLKVIS